MQKKNLLTAAIVVAVVAALGYGWWQATRDKGLPEGLVQANGRLEGDAIRVATKYGGRLVEVNVHEGDRVQPKQVIATLSADEINARLAASRAGVKAARAQVERATAAYAQAKRDAGRYAELLSRGSVARIQAEQATLAALSAQTQLAQAVEQMHQAEAAQTEAATVQREQTLRAPAGGVITQRLREPGDVVAAGAAVAEIVDFDRLYLKVYIPENQIGRVRLGLPARIYTDAFPESSFEATVTSIASRAEFTPKEVQTPDERVKLVYAVKLSLKVNPDLKLTPGLPADAVIRWKNDVAWQKPRW